MTKQQTFVGLVTYYLSSRIGVILRRSIMRNKKRDILTNKSVIINVVAASNA